MTERPLLSIGTTAAGGPMAIDVDRLIGSHACIVANSGGGKSGAIRRLLEVTHNRIQHIVLDIEDEFYTLRERFDYVIAGGDGGDLPAHAGNAETLPIAALEHGFSLIVQLNDLGYEGAPEFIGRFLKAMIAAPRHLWHPVLVVVDEAQRVVPRAGATGATEGVRALISQGRKRGFTGLLAGTKLTDIDPSVRGSLNNWMLGRVGQSLDRRTMGEQLGFSQREARENLLLIEPRHFWAFGPALTREPTLFRVADTATTIVHRGEARLPTPPAPEALRAILQGLAAAPASTSAEVDRQTPATPIAAFDAGAEAGELLLQKDARIRELEADVAQLTAEVARLSDRVDERHGALREVHRLAGELVAAFDNPSLELVSAGHEAAPPRGQPPLPPAEGETRSRAKVARPVSVSPNPGSGAGAGNPGRGRKALAALARIYPAELSEKQWATLAGYAQSGGTWGTYKSALRAAGFVEQLADGNWRATRAGVAAAGEQIQPLPAPGPERARFWGQKVPGVRRIVDVLIKRSPHFTTLKALGADVSMAWDGGTFGTYVSRLRSNGLLEEQGKGENKKVRLAPAIMGFIP